MPNLMLHPILPAQITQKFGERPDTYAQFGMKGHNGIDYHTKFPDTPDGKRNVLAPYWGIVRETGNDGTKTGYGKFLRIDLPDGAQIVLGHLASFKVKAGDAIEPGQIIAIADNTGFSTAAHLHFGYRPPNWNINNGFKGYTDQLPLLTDDLQKVLATSPSHPVPTPPVNGNFADQFQGKILVAVEDHGRKWYVWDGLRYEIDKAPAFELKLQRRPAPPFAVFISNLDLNRIPIGN